jgi:ParB family chromosome partitioning protein
MLRLLRLPAQVQDWLSESKLTTGHAKALLSLSDLDAIINSARQIIQGNYSVRQAEMLVSRQTKQPAPVDAAPATEDPNVKAAIHALEQVLGTKVTMHENGGKGRVEIHFFSFEEMNRLYEGLMRIKFGD